MALLIVKQKGLETKNYSVSGGALTAGRANTNDIILANRFASARHCEIICEDGRCTVKDLNSTNGLFVNGAKVTSKVLEDGDRVLAGAAMLIFIADEKAIDMETLVRRLKRGDAGEREIAATLLGQLGEAAAVIPLIKSLQEDLDGKVKAAAAEALGLLGEPRASKALLAHFDTQDALLRSAVVRAILRIADDGVVADIARFLRHPEKKVRMLAAHALGQTHGAQAAKELQQALQDEFFDVREAAVKALGELRDPEVVDILLKLAQEPQRYPYVWVVDSLGKIGNPKALPALMAALQHHSFDVKEAAMDGVTRLRAKEAIPALISFLDDANARLRQSAAKALEKLRKYVEVERQLSGRRGDARETMEISTVGEQDSRPIEAPLFGENKTAWEQWWLKQSQLE
jgi:HEAT repeat protein